LLKLFKLLNLLKVPEALELVGIFLQSSTLKGKGSVDLPGFNP
jgi:hypothetical protein